MYWFGGTEKSAARFSTPACLTWTLAELAALDAELGAPDEPLEPQAEIRTAAPAAASSGTNRILFLIINSLSGMAVYEARQRKYWHSAIESVPRNDGAIRNVYLVNTASAREGFPCRLPKFIYMSNEQTGEAFGVTRGQG